MEQTMTLLGKSGRVVIPAHFRKALGLREGDELYMRLEDDTLRILTSRQALVEVQRLVRQYVDADRDLVGELLAERRREVADG